MQFSFFRREKVNGLQIEWELNAYASTTCILIGKKLLILHSQTWKKYETPTAGHDQLHALIQLQILQDGLPQN